MKPRILVIDDESAIRDSLKMILEYEGYEVQGAATGQDGLALADREAADLVLLDIKMAGMDGLEVLQRLRATHEALPVIMISGHATVSTAVEATKLGAFDFIEKPLSTERVLVSVRNALDQQRLTQEVVAFRRTETLKHQLVGESAAVRGVLEAVKRAAPTSATVLITGESGVGKELVARAIHRNSLRARERFIQVNCAAIPDDLIESELFGHEKGSFTGATEKQVGKFEQADRGTIVLDEVGDMSLKTQAKVLRVLQEGEVERLGSSKTMKVDVRVIAATSRDLGTMVAQGLFRADLYYRLNVLPIRLPALRERLADIEALAEALLDDIARRGGLPHKSLSSDALDRLARHDWPGNIRELRNVLEQAALMTDELRLDAPHLDGALRRMPGSDLPRPALPALPPAPPLLPAAASSGPVPAEPRATAAVIKPLPQAVAELEGRAIREALAATGGNKLAAARLLGIARATLYEKLPLAERAADN
jgi:two-component system nitrogen regulation response regulator NtrX